MGSTQENEAPVNELIWLFIEIDDQAYVELGYCMMVKGKRQFRFAGGEELQPDMDLPAFAMLTPPPDPVDAGKYWYPANSAPRLTRIWLYHSGLKITRPGMLLAGGTKSIMYVVGDRMEFDVTSKLLWHPMVLP